MKPLIRVVLSVCSLGFAPGLLAQVTDTTVCQVLANPASFDGKIVRIKGTVIAGFEEFAVRDVNCGQPVNAIWLAYPQGTKGKAGPAAFLQLQLAKNNPAPANDTKHLPVKLDKNKDFKQFDSLLSTPFKSGGMCLGCVRYTVTATLIGRLDGASEPGLVRDVSGKYIAASGFGNLNGYSARLVLQSVADVAAAEIDYSKAAAQTKDDTSRESAGGDPVAAAHQVAREFGPNSTGAKQLERAAAAYGKEGDDNGVEVGFGVANEAPTDEPVKGKTNSPDGLLLNCTFDTDRLKGDALTRAISHLGTHIADIRESNSTKPESNLYQLEYQGWFSVVLSAVGSQQKTLTSPGGYVVWNAA